MKNLWIAIIIAGFIYGPVNSYGQELQKEEKAELATSEEPISFDKTTHNFGDIDKDIPASAIFTIKNNRNEPLIITAVSTSCGCTAPMFPKEPIQPGKSGEIKLTYNAKVSGYFKKSAQVKTKDGKFYTLYIDGTVKAKPVEEIK